VIIMAEPLSPVQNQTIVMKVGHESSHLSSLQQYATIAASMNSAQNVVKRAEREASSTTNVQPSDQKKTKTATEGESQGSYYASSQSSNKKKSPNSKIEEENAHILDVRV